MKKTMIVLGLMVGVTSSASRALAWGDLGHEIVGGVAEQMIEPQTKDYIRGLMGLEPLSVSAVFPDHVRDDERFGHKDYNPATHDADDHDFSDYHFCEIPTGSTYDTKTIKNKKDCLGAINGSIALLEDTSGGVSRAEKMIALRYLVHVMGDITQPLHVGNGYDRGGNTCQIKYQFDDSKPAQDTNLHSFWDDTMVTYLGSTYRHKARYLSDFLSAFATSRADLLSAAAKAKEAQGTLKSWLADSQALRESGVYPDAPAGLSAVPAGQEYKFRPYCQWYDPATGKLGEGSKVDKTKIPLLGKEYAQKFGPIVEAQLIKGGLRLAATLDQIAASVAKSSRPSALLTTEQQEKILSDVQAAFRKASNK